MLLSDTSSLIAICPYCGKPKYLSVLLSGNTFYSDYWSDSFVFHGMLPQISPILKCESCGKYYFTAQQTLLEWSHKKGEGFGNLVYLEIKEAIAQFKEENIFETHEILLRKLLLFTYNDWFFRGRFKDNIPNDGDKSLFMKNAYRLIKLADDSSNEKIFKAELYREMSIFDKSIAVIDSLPCSSKLATMIRNRAIDNDSLPFNLNLRQMVSGENEIDFSYFQILNQEQYHQFNIRVPNSDETHALEWDRIEKKTKISSLFDEFFLD